MPAIGGVAQAEVTFRFYLGTQDAHWLNDVPVRMLISRPTLLRYKTWRWEAKAPWALDSGGFTEVTDKGGWTISAREYVEFVTRAAETIGRLEWAAPQDWMCEDVALRATGLTVEDHQRLTIDNYLDLATLSPVWIIPVLQGQALDDYLRHRDAYEARGVDLAALPLVGLGSVCRRQGTFEIERVVTRLADLRLHGFGMKIGGLQRVGHELASADSLAWTWEARWNERRGIRTPGCRHKRCHHCRKFALAWRERVTRSIALRLPLGRYDL